MNTRIVIDSDQLQPFPPVPDELLRRLKAAFPNTCPASSVPMDEVRALAGVQRVIAFLAEQHRLQNEENEPANVLRQ